MRSVVVVLPAAMCAMIPMLRVLWSVNLRGMARSGGSEMSVGATCSGQKNGAPRAHARCWSCLDRFASLSARGDLHLDSCGFAAGRLARLRPDAMRGRL